MKLSRIGHPSMRKLQRWLAGEDLPLERHLSTCEYCCDRLEPLLDDSDVAIRSALLRLLVVPDHLPETLQVSIDKSLNDRRDLALIGEFFGLPFRTARVFTSTDQEDE